MKHKKWIDGWKIRNWVDWWIVTLSFLVFLMLEGAIIYSYYMFLRAIG